MANIKGELVHGVEVDNVTHTSFELGPLRVRTYLESQRRRADLAESDNTAQTKESLTVLASRLVSLGTLSREQITGELLLDLALGDLTRLTEEAEALDNGTFRGATRSAAQGNSVAGGGDGLVAVGDPGAPHA